MPVSTLKLEGKYLEVMRDVTLTLLTYDTGAVQEDFDVVKRAHARHGELWREIIDYYELDEDVNYIFDHVSGNVYEEA